MTDPSPLLFFSLGTRSARAQIAGLMIGPVGLPLFAGLILWAMIRSPFPAADLFPAFVALELFLYLGAGLAWAFASALLASAVALGGFFFSMAPLGPRSVRPAGGFGVGGVLGPHPIRSAA
jgi:hypothetical protein